MINPVLVDLPEAISLHVIWSVINLISVPLFRIVAPVVECIKFWSTTFSSPTSCISFDRFIVLKVLRLVGVMRRFNQRSWCVSKEILAFNVARADGCSCVSSKNFAMFDYTLQRSLIGCTILFNVGYICELQIEELRPRPHSTPQGGYLNRRATSK